MGQEKTQSKEEFKRLHHGVDRAGVRVMPKGCEEEGMVERTGYGMHQWSRTVLARCRTR